MANKNNKKASLGWFFWVAFILLIALLFFINKDNIRTVLEKTNAKKIFQKNEKEELKTEAELMEIQNEIEKITAESEKNGTDSQQLENGYQSNSAAEKTAEKTEKLPEKNTKPATDKQTETVKTAEEKNKKDTAGSKNTLNRNDSTRGIEEQKTKPQTGTGISQTEKRTIFFAQVETDGKIIRKPVTRQIRKTDSPMSEAIKVLLQGPSIEEAKKGLRSFIPPETELISAYVKNGTAFINFSEEFQFNRYGIEAYYAQLAQIVFTVCEFPTVETVQFLIEGRHKEYLGGEGVWIGSPFSKASF